MEKEVKFKLLKNIGNLKKGQVFDCFRGLVFGVTATLEEGTEDRVIKNKDKPFGREVIFGKPPKTITLNFNDEKWFSPVFK